MSSRMQRHRDAVARDLFAILQSLQRNALPESGAQHAFSRGCCQIMPVPHAGVISVRVGYHGAVYRAPRVDKKSPTGQYKPSGL